MCLLNFVKSKGSFDRYHEFSGFEPLEKKLQVRREVLRFASQAEEGRSLAGPEKKVSRKQFQHHGTCRTPWGLCHYWQVDAIPNENASLLQDRIGLIKAFITQWIEHGVGSAELPHGRDPVFRGVVKGNGSVLAEFFVLM